MAIISAQPMSRPSLSQPGRSLQASQISSKMMPMPHEDEASTQNSTEEGVGGFESDEPQKGEAS